MQQEKCGYCLCWLNSKTKEQQTYLKNINYKQGVSDVFRVLTARNKFHSYTKSEHLKSKVYESCLGVLTKLGTCRFRFRGFKDKNILC